MTMYEKGLLLHPSPVFEANNHETVPENGTLGLNVINPV
jgi:hypothetical protein